MYESGENYLETTLVLSKRNTSVRAIDIARELDFSKPSVSRAIGILKEDGYIIIDTDGAIKLTETGKQKAESVYERHQLLTEFLMKIAAVPYETAEEDACKMEHVISEVTFHGLKNFLMKQRKG